MDIERTIASLVHGPVPRRRRVAVGNAVCLVVVDSAGSYWERCIVEQTMLVALEHAGIPYRVVDVAQQALTPELLAGCAAILLAQNGLGASLSEKDSRLIADAVHAGVGLVNFDYDLRRQRGPLCEIFGFERIEPNIYATNRLRISDRPHYITAMQRPGELHQLEQMVSALAIGGWRPDVKVLAHGILAKEQLVYSRHLIPNSALLPGHMPAAFAARWGRGRAVQFTINLRIWLNTVYGHARELGDLFWRSIVWAARKPLAANLAPPLVCLSLDDCDGRYDFRYAEAAHEHGFAPLPALNIRNVPVRLLPVIRELIDSGKALFNTHAMDYYELLNFNFGRGECSREELDARFAEHDAFWRQVGAAPSETVRMHWGEYGVRALPYFKQRGMRYFNPILAMGLLKMDQAGAAGYRPFGVTHRMYDYLPDDAELFGVQSMSSRRGGEDFLTGCTPWLGETPALDVEKAARSAADSIIHGLRSGMFGEAVTHEPKLDVMSLDEWGRILARTAELIRPCEPIFATHDEISHYMQDKDSTAIAEADYSGNSLRLGITGRASAQLRLSVFDNEDEGVRREYMMLDPFQDKAEITR